MTELLISIRNEREASILRSWDGGIVDFKHPDRGALGALDKTQVGQMLIGLADSCIKSIALGELTEWLRFDPQAPSPLERNRIGHDRLDPARDRALLQKFQFVKVGLSNTTRVRDWQHHWLSFMNLMPPSTRPVGVVYVDGAAAGCPPIEAVIELVSSVTDGAVLLDTIEKSSGTLLSHLSPVRVARIIDRCHRLDLPIAIAGSVRTTDLPTLIACGPDFIGVRGAVCAKDRTQLDPVRLADFVAAFQQARPRLPTTDGEPGKSAG